MRTPPRRRRLRAAAAAVALAPLIAGIAGCSDGDGGPAGPGAGGVAIALGSTQVTVVQGSSATVSVLVTRTGDFTGPVSVSAEGLPTGVTAATTTIAGGATGGTLELSAAAAAATGTTTVTVRATGSGVDAATAQLQLVVAEPPSFAFTLAAETVALEAGGSASVGIQITRAGGFAGGVTFSVAGLPEGLTAAVDPTPVTGATATIVVEAAESLAAGDYDATVTGTGSGVPDRSAALRVTVGQAAGSFELAVVPTALTVAAGGTATATVTIAREGGFTGAVALSGTAPAGITLAFDPESVTGDQATVTVQVPQGAPAGGHAATITGAGSGVESREATLAVEVTAAGGPGNVTWAFCPGTGIPVWVAVQDGDGPWTPVTPADDRVTFQVDSGRGGITYVSPSATGAFVSQLFFGTTAELQTRAAAQCGTAAGAGKTVNATVIGMGPTDHGYAALGSSATSFGGAQQGIVFQDVPSGTVDLFAARSRLENPGGIPALVADKVVVRRGLDPAPGSTLSPIDFGSAEAFDPAMATVTVTGSSGERLNVISAFRTTNNTYGTLFSDLGEATDPTRPYWGVPADRAVAGDFHQLFVSATTPELDRIRLTSLVFRDVADRTLDLGPDLAAAAVSVVQSSPYQILSASLPRQPEYDLLFTFQGISFTTGHQVVVLATAGYVGGADPVVLSWGDYTGLAGFQNGYMPPAGSMIWQVSAAGAILGDHVTDPWVEGTAFRMAIRAGGTP